MNNICLSDVIINCNYEHFTSAARVFMYLECLKIILLCFDIYAAFFRHRLISIFRVTLINYFLEITRFYN